MFVGPMQRGGKTGDSSMNDAILSREQPASALAWNQEALGFVPRAWFVLRRVVELRGFEPLTF